MGVHLAALINSDYASGLATSALLSEDVTDTPLIPINGEIPVGRVEASEDKLLSLTAPAERVEWWLKRLKKSLETN